jgi:hypothetical protein
MRLFGLETPNREFLMDVHHRGIDLRVSPGSDEPFGDNGFTMT